MSFDKENNMSNNIVVVKGDIVRTWGSMKSDGWTWFDVRDGRGSVRRVTGCVPKPITEGMVVKCECMETYSEYGRQFKICGQIEIDIATREAVVAYLASSQFQGIGRKTAECLYDAFGEQTIEMIENDMDTVCKAVSLSQKQRDALSDVSSFGPAHQLLKVFPSIGGKASKVVDYFRNEMCVYEIKNIISSIRERPWVLKKVCPFSVVDDVLTKDLHIPLDDKNRMCFVIEHFMSQVMREYHNTYISTAEEFDRLAFLVTTKCVMASSVQDGIRKYQSAGQWLFYAMISYYHDDRMVHVNQRPNGVYHFYTERMWYAKNHLTEQLISLLEKNRTTSQFYIANHKKFDTWWQYSNQSLNNEQKLAVKTAVTNNLSFISGGPGRGKTHTASALLDFWLTHYQNVLLLAPTGRAANKLKLETGYDNIGTIARFVQMNMNQKSISSFRDVLGNDMASGSKTLVVVDEVSMLDFEEAVSLFSIVNGCTIVFLGDINQLAPIEPGCFLYEVLKVHQVYSLPITILQENMRTNIPILADNADRILDGTLTPKLHFDTNFVFDFTFSGIANGQEITADDADRLTCEKAFDYYMNCLSQGYATSDIMLLCPTKKGQAGTTVLNRYFQEHLNPVAQKFLVVQDANNQSYCVTKGYECKGFIIDDTCVRVMDRLMQTKNDSKMCWRRYENNDPDKKMIDEGSGFFNGDVCTVIRYYEASGKKPAAMLVQTDDGRTFHISCELECYRDLCFGYAITVHKSQGSEASCIIVVLTEESSKNRWLKTPFLTRNLLYTAVTRAKEQVSILGSKTAMDLALKSEQYIGNATVADDVLKFVMKRGSYNI